MAKKLAEVENPMVLERPAYRSPEPVYPIIVADPLCPCCGKTVEVKEFQTQDGEWLFDESCWTNISYKEGWLKRVG